MNENVISFYRDLGLINDEMLKYLNKHIYFISEEEKDCFSYVGCYTKEEDGVLKAIHVTLPCGDKLETTCMQVHEMAHFIDAYPYLNKPYKERSGVEVFPIAMERLFIEKTGNTELIEWFNHYQYNIIQDLLFSNQDEHILGLLHHFDYLDMYKENGSIPQLIEFNIRDGIDIRKELNEKSKSLLKTL